ncbi:MULTISPECIES: aldo/keto reductase [unclassified Streptomyces]|uniref:aldo/keto reductase n=1 Tax=Streptomyces TaxID=1883 RepID=UPI0001C1930B|nr:MULTISPECIES: aldo/keto reductase [unclassified Streptomyces]AEN09548.1 aldo/keto reductase [Streptomyces sp. SirexAA-E]MYR70208.1 aldo/keto reductase [Streptomyces sp. SID4939]MYS03890.1 aldo/keto reductase [Streptomyces sp. SID4940]MYT64592.1 aldo/keto reductase [Streptomyces sp. SID8357]MYT87405.1 aldo/keto reductase [Streptomyces sp. SID8360]
MTTTTFSLGGDLTINRLGFGAMRLPMSTFDGPTRTPENGIAVLRRAVELGVDHIDTAGFYNRGDVRANELIRTALSPYRDGLVIATKVGPLPGPDGMPSRQASPDQLRGLVETDLRALGLDRLDLVYLRVGGMSGPGGESIAERFEVLAGLREEGLIRHLGVSNVDAAQFAEARTVAPVTAVQNSYADDPELLAECEAAGIAFVPFFLLGGGGSGNPLDTERLGKVAARLGATPAQVQIASLLALSPSVLAIPGTGSLDHLEENCAAGGLVLGDEDLAYLRG